MQKRIVVLGGVGFIGSHLCRRLLNEGQEVFCVDLRDATNAPMLREVRRNPHFHYIHHNIIHPFGIRCDELYNLVAPSMVRYNKALPVETLKLAMQGSIHALDTARSEHARVLYASTGSIYSALSRNGNDHPLTTSRIVAESKRAGEALHRAYRAEFGVDTRIARIFNTYGGGSDLMDQRVVMKMVMAALQNREVVIEGSGEQLRTFCYVEDMVEGLVRLMAAAPTPATRTINLGGGEEISIRALAEKIIELAGSRSRITHIEARSEDTRRRMPDLTAARNELGWRPTTTLTEGLKQTIRSVEQALGERAASVYSWVEFNN